MPTYTTEQIASVTDHTFLKTADELHCSESALEGKLHDFFNEMASFPHKPYAVCVRSDKVRLTRIILGNLGLAGKVKIAAVVGFPDGNAYPTALKTLETQYAMGEGANEIDMVLKYDTFKAGNLPLAGDDINDVAKTAHVYHGKLKVILETTMLAPQGVAQASVLALTNGADFIKTGTGYDIKAAHGIVKNKGATEPDLKLMRTYAERQYGVKAAGGVNAKNVHSILDAALNCDGIMVPLHPDIVRIGASGLLKQLYAGQDAPKPAY